ncbi:MAG: hypothetical protein U0R26_06895 [Solirubrobacterales bacterium]
MPGTPEPDLAGEAIRLLSAAEDKGISTRLIGGMAIRLITGERLDPAFVRDIADLDFVVARKGGSKLGELLAASGYQPEAEFNALNSARRMLFWDPAHGRQVDVFVGGFEMCHVRPLADRLEQRPQTLPAAELLMTKLQIVELNAKDRADAFALLHAHEVSDADRDASGEDAINMRQISFLTSRDWGLQRTFEINFERLNQSVGELPIESRGKELIGDRIARLRAEIDAAPKSRKWKLRDRVGERKQWYETPEEVDRA